MSMLETRPDRSLWRESALTVAAGAAVMVFCASLLLIDRGFFWSDDYQITNLPGMCDIVRAWREGELPLLSRSSWRCGALAAEYPNAVFAPLPTLSVMLAIGLGLSLPLTAALVSAVHLALLASGAFRLARLRGLSVDLALLVAWIASLNGFLFFTGGRIWLPYLVSFAWIPWFWWALERGGDERHGRARFVLPGIFLALVITAGWHFTVLMAGMLTVWFLLRTRVERGMIGPLWPTFAAWVVGLGLSAPAWMMFLEYVGSTARGQGGQLWFSDSWMVSLDNLPNLVFPHFISISGVYYDSPHMGIELTGGLVPLVILAAALFSRGPALFRTLRWECGLLAFLFLLITSPSFGNFRFSFRWLALFFLVLALLAGQTLAELRRPMSPERTEGRVGLPNLGRWCFCLVLIVWCRAMMLSIGPMRLLSNLGLGFLVVSFFWLQVEQRWAAAASLRRVMPSVVVLATCWLTYAICAPFYEIATWEIGEEVRRPQPLDPAIRYMSLFTNKDVWDNDPTRMIKPSRGIGAEIYVGNLAMYSGVEFVSGYSAMGPSGLEEVLPFRKQGFATEESIERLLKTETGSNGLLELLGVDGLVVAERFAAYRPVLAANGWEEIAQVKGGIVFHRIGPRSDRVRSVARAEVCADRVEVPRQIARRDGAVPIILSEGGNDGRRRFDTARLNAIKETRNRVALEVDSPGADGSLIVFSRPWFPGYRAYLDGKPLPVEVADLMLPAVRLPPGAKGHLVLEYWPRSLVLGCWVAVVTASFLVVIQLLCRVTRGARQSKTQQPAAQAGGVTPQAVTVHAERI